MTETLKVKFDDEQMAKIIYKVTEKLMLDANRIKVVRCKDCKHWNITSDGFGECNVMDKQFLGKEYCSFGESKEDGN